MLQFEYLAKQCDAAPVDFQLMQKSANPIKIVFLDRGTFPKETTLRAPAFNHSLSVYESTSLTEVQARIADADIVITNKVVLNGSTIESASRLQMIAVAATGYDAIDVGACQRRGIVVSNIRNYAVNTVPEHTFALILALRRSIVPYRQSVAAGDWQKSGQFCYFDFPIHNLAGSTIGIIGDGALGQSVAKLAQAFGMRVLFSAYKGVSGMGPLYTPFEEVLRQSDVISLHSPLMASTRNMISTREFQFMERQPLLINTARGGLVDEQALYEAMTNGQIAGAGFDVVTTEPPPADHPLMRLLDLPNFILTPHVAWASREAVQGLADQLIENIELFESGSPRNVVQPI
jgi:glycerate dehydrogenase